MRKNKLENNKIIIGTRKSELALWQAYFVKSEIENPENVPKYDQIQKWCTMPEDAPDEAEYVDIEFEKGVPIAVNGSKKKLSELILDCHTVGSKHGVGVTTLIEDRLIGLKVRGIYEEPAAQILIQSHKKLEQLVSTREENELKEFMDSKWAYLTYAAKWYDPVMYHIHAFINSQNQKVTGKVKVKLYKGNIHVVSCSSPHSLFDDNLATFNRNAAFNQNASAGFIELHNLAQKTAYQMFDYEENLGKN